MIVKQFRVLSLSREDADNISDALGLLIVCKYKAMQLHTIDAVQKLRDKVSQLSFSPPPPMPFDTCQDAHCIITVEHRHVNHNGTWEIEFTRLQPSGKP